MVPSALFIFPLAASDLPAKALVDAGYDGIVALVVADCLRL